MFLGWLVVVSLLSGSIAGSSNLTATPIETGSIVFNWIDRSDANLYYILCSQESYEGDFGEELTFVTTFTSALVTGFESNVGYRCTLSHMHEDESKNTEKVINVQSVGGVSIGFVSGTPAVDGSSIMAKFSIAGSVNVIICCINPGPQSGNKCVKCTDGQVSYSVNPGSYRLRVIATNSNYDTVTVSRLIYVPDTSYGCAVNLINDGMTVSDDEVIIQFVGVGSLTGYACYLDGQAFSDECSSPVTLEKPDSGWHYFKVIATGDGCVERQPLKINFLV